MLSGETEECLDEAALGELADLPAQMGGEAARETRGGWGSYVQEDKEKRSGKDMAKIMDDYDEGW